MSWQARAESAAGGTEHSRAVLLALFSGGGGEGVYGDRGTAKGSRTMEAPVILTRGLSRMSGFSLDPGGYSTAFISLHSTVHFSTFSE